MKKTLTFLFLMLAALTGISACQTLPEQGPAYRVTASLETMTRTQLVPEGDIYKVYWTAGDRIAVTSASGTAYYTADSGGATTATFSLAEGVVPSGGRFTAWYPASLAEGSLPAVQIFRADGTVETPMCAEAESLDFCFRNLCGVIRLDVVTPLQGIHIDRIVLQADQGLSGQFYRSGDIAVVPGSDGVRLDCGGVALGEIPVSFYVNVPANIYTGLSITLYTRDGRSQQVRLKEGASYCVERSEVCEIALSAADFETNQYEPARLRPGADFNHLIKSLSGTKRGATEADTTVKRVVFETGSKVSEGLHVESYDSPWPVYMNWRQIDSTIIVSTPAGSFRTGSMCAYMFAYLYMLEEVVNFKSVDTTPALDVDNMFAYAGYRSSRLTVDLSAMRTPNVTNFYRMFYFCESVEELDLSGFDTSNAVTMDNMFRSCRRLRKLDLSSFNTSRVKTFRSMFNMCESLEELNIDNFNTDSGELMSYMFYKMGKVRKISIRGMNINRSTTTVYYFFQGNPNLEELYVGDGFRRPEELSMPSSFFAGASDAAGFRTASNVGSLRIYCTAASADWLARTTLRFLHSGYRNAARIDVTFTDDATGVTLSPTWAPN